MRITASALLSLRKSLMTSEALSVTVSICFPPFEDVYPASISRINYPLLPACQLQFCPDCLRLPIYSQNVEIVSVDFQGLSRL
jgi:hypothetical protein